MARCGLFGRFERRCDVETCHPVTGALFRNRPVRHSPADFYFHHGQQKQQRTLTTEYTEYTEKRHGITDRSGGRRAKILLSVLIVRSVFSVVIVRCRFPCIPCIPWLKSAAVFRVFRIPWLKSVAVVRVTAQWSQQPGNRWRTTFRCVDCGRDMSCGRSRLSYARSHPS